MEIEVTGVEEVVENASDSDVDVDDSGPSSVPHLSSAQLLMQATQATQVKQLQQAISNKPKGKLVAAAPPKPKAVQTKPPQLTQIAKPKPATSLSGKQGAQPSGGPPKLVGTVAKAALPKTVANASQVKQIPAKQPAMPKQVPLAKHSPKQMQTKSVVVETPKTVGPVKPAVETVPKSLPSVVLASKPLIKQKVPQKLDTPPSLVSFGVSYEIH